MKGKIFLFAFLLFSSFYFGNIQGVHAETIEVEFPASKVRLQEKKITLPNLLKVNQAIVNNGTVTYQQDGENLNITVNNGTENKVQSGGEYIPEQTKTVTNQLTQNYNHDGYTGTLTQYLYSGTYTEAATKYVTNQPSSSYNQDGYTGTLTSYLASGTYTPEQTKTVTDQPSANYNQDGYTGTLTRYLHSGTLTESDTKYVTNQTSANYNSGGYVGTLTSYVYSGSYTPADTKEAEATRVDACQDLYEWTGKAWLDGDAGAIWEGSKDYEYNKGGYSGTLKGYKKSSCESDFPTGKGKTVGEIKAVEGVITVYFKGNVTKPAVDTRVYRYQGNVTKPASDTRVYRYQGNVTKPASDTRVYRYQGNVTKPASDTRVYRYQGTVKKPAQDTRTWETYYSYKVTITYSKWVPVKNPLNTSGLTLNGSSQYFSVANSFNQTGNFTWGTIIKPKSLTDQTILSNDAITIALKDGLIKGIVKTNKGTTELGFDSKYLYLNSWTFLALSREGNSLNFYYNDQLVSTKELAANTAVSNGKSLLVGSGYKSDGQPGLFFNGDIKNVNLWDRALTTNEIKSAAQAALQDGRTGSWVFQNYTTAQTFDKNNANHATGKGFSSNTELIAAGIDDMGMNLRWTQIPNVTSYEIKRNNEVIYSGSGSTLNEEALVSDTSYSYSITPKGADGIGVSDNKTFKTTAGSLEIISAPTNLSLNQVTLNGEIQKSLGTFNGKLIIKDTRKVRNGFKLSASASVLTSSNQAVKLPGGSITLKSVNSIRQTAGLKQALPTIVSVNQAIDKGAKNLLTADSSKTGYGIFEITLPDNALEIILNPGQVYVNKNGSSLDYSSQIDWNISPGL